MDELLNEALKHYKDMQQPEPDNLSLPKFHEAMQKLIERQESAPLGCMVIASEHTEGSSANGAVAESRKDKLYRTAIQIYGAENQMNQLIEECAELIQSVNKYRRKGSENILEEVADVEIMIEQTKMILGEELTKIIEIHKENKLDRLAGKLSLKATASL